MDFAKPLAALKNLFEAGYLSEDVYKEKQREILQQFCDQSVGRDRAQADESSVASCVLFQMSLSFHSLCTGSNDPRISSEQEPHSAI